MAILPVGRHRLPGYRAVSSPRSFILHFTHSFFCTPCILYAHDDEQTMHFSIKYMYDLLYSLVYHAIFIIFTYLSACS